VIRRFLAGIVLGLLVGGAIAAALVAGLKVAVFEGTAGAFEAYGAAIVVGLLAGLVAGKPIWALDAKIEAGLKAFFGSLLAAGAMYALRRWAPSTPLDLHALGAGGPAAPADLPAVALPAIGAVLGAFFELDNTGDTKSAGATRPSPGPRVAAAPASNPKSKGRRTGGGEDDLGGSTSASKRAKN
jgi:hypothetical protein